MSRRGRGQADGACLPASLEWSDRILIEGLRASARIGVTEAERRRRQRVEIDLELALDLRRAGRQDRVEATLDYTAAARLARALVEDRPHRLVEAAAEAIAQALLRRFRPRQVRVRIRKFSVPGSRNVGVEVIRPAAARRTRRRRSRFPRSGPARWGILGRGPVQR